MGGDLRVSDRLLAGLQFGFTEYRGRFGNDAGSFTLRAPMLTLYAGYDAGSWYAGATLGAGALDYRTTRTIALGPATRTETGATTGYQGVARLQGGYWFRNRGIQHGPFARFTYANIVGVRMPL